MTEEGVSQCLNKLMDFLIFNIVANRVFHFALRGCGIKLSFTGGFRRVRVGHFRVPIVYKHVRHVVCKFTRGTRRETHPA